MDRLNKERYSREIQDEISLNILPFWDKVIDRERGGFFGRIRNDGKIIENAPKSAVLNTRILWTYSAVFRYLEDRKYLDLAERAYSYILHHFQDREEGGIFWMVDAYGNPIEKKKQIYAQAFCIYALSEYFFITKDPKALDLAVQIFSLIEAHGYDPGFSGYQEAFSREWDLLEDVRLSEKDKNERKSMNTHLHLLEAYTNLSKVWKSQKLKQQLERLVAIFIEKIIDPKTGHSHLFFDDRWNVRSDIVSYGHDIEASWLLYEAGEVLRNQELSAKIEKASLRLTEITLKEGVDKDGGLMNEGNIQGVVDSDKHWWPQAEAMVGLLNAFQTTEEVKFYEASYRCWEFVKTHIVDREFGEWFFRVDRQGNAYRIEEDKVGPWKGPYHNTRSCLELLRRLESPMTIFPLS